MSRCDSTERIEELALGSLSEEDALRARTHLAICGACREEHACFVAERALFARRASMTVAAPYIAPAFDAVPPADGRRLFARITPALLAVAACMAAITGMDQLRAGPLGTDAPASMSEPAPAEAGDEPLCSLPVSGVARFSGTMGDRGLACSVPVAASDDGVACEEPLATWQRVTSSVATP